MRALSKHRLTRSSTPLPSCHFMHPSDILHLACACLTHTYTHTHAHTGVYVHMVVYLLVYPPTHSHFHPPTHRRPLTHAVLSLAVRVFAACL